MKSYCTYKTQFGRQIIDAIVIDGYAKRPFEWAELIGISDATLSARIKRGLDPYEAVFSKSQYSHPSEIVNRFPQWPAQTFFGDGE